MQIKNNKSIMLTQNYILFSLAVYLLLINDIPHVNIAIIEMAATDWTL